MQKENVFFFSFSSESNFSKGESYKFYFTSAIRLHTSDIFQPYFVCKDTPFLLITYAKTENVISWKIDFMQVQKENHSYDRYQSLLSYVRFLRSDD